MDTIITLTIAGVIFLASGIMGIRWHDQFWRSWLMFTIMWTPAYWVDFDLKDSWMVAIFFSIIVGFITMIVVNTVASWKEPAG